MSTGAENGEIWIQYTKNNIFKNNIVYAREDVNKFRICEEKEYESGNLFENNIYYTEDGPDSAVFMINKKPMKGFTLYQQSKFENGATFKNPYAQTSGP
jgi:hypothetical protein